MVRLFFGRYVFGIGNNLVCRKREYICILYISFTGGRVFLVILVIYYVVSMFKVVVMNQNIGNNSGIFP